MIKLNDIIEVEAEKLSYGLNAIARTSENNFTIFIKNAIPKDKLKVKIVSLNKKYATGEIVEIIEPSEYRVKPFCALFNACGSCNFQNCEYNYLIEQKEIILKDIFKNIVDEKYILPIVKCSKIQEYRHKVQFPCRETKNSKRVLLGYFKENSHELTNIKYCPLVPSIINEITEYIRDNYKSGCYSEENNKGLLKNILFRISSYDDSILLTFVLNSQNVNSEIKNFLLKLQEKFPKIKGTFANLNPEKSNKILSNTTIKISGDDFIEEKLNDKIYKIGATGFFQVNPFMADKLFNIVKENVKENSAILDAYGGVGAIGIYLKEKASKITLVEENENAILCAEKNFKLNNIKNYEILKGDAKKHFIDFEKEKRIFDYVILDPPRKGCDKEGLLKVSKLANNIIYVSCNPQTLRRDMIYLIEEGFKVKFIQGVDLFPYTYHIESVCLFEKEV